MFSLREQKSKIIHTILNNCASIKELTFHRNEFPSNTSPLRQMDEVEKLTIDDGDDGEKEEYLEDPSRQQNFTRFLEKVPNVKDLVFDGKAMSYMLNKELVPTLFRNVTFLDLTPTLCDVGGLQLQEFKFPNLTSLAIEVRSRRGLVALENICSQNMNLKYLEVTSRTSMAFEITDMNIIAESNMLKLYAALGHTGVEKFKLIQPSFKFLNRRTETNLILIRTKAEIEMKQFGRILTDDERICASSYFI